MCLRAGRWLTKSIRQYVTDQIDVMQDKFDWIRRRLGENLEYTDANQVQSLKDNIADVSSPSPAARCDASKGPPLTRSSNSL